MTYLPFSGTAFAVQRKVIQIQRGLIAAALYDYNVSFAIIDTTCALNDFLLAI